MKRHVRAAVLMAVVTGAAAMAMAQGGPAPAAAGRGAATVGGEVKRDVTDVPVRRVVLFSSGVGFFQHAGKVTGNAATELRFKTDQINDILKSLVVSDTAGGTVKSITYGSQNPVARTLKSFQIDISSNPTLAGILNQIRGAKITATLADEKVEGTVLGVEEKDRPVGPPGRPEEQKVVKVSYVNLITAGGIRSLPLDDVRKLELQDEALQKELDQALAALAQARDKDKRPVIVNFDGTGERTVGIAYLVETPVWKTSYRLVLPDAASRDSASLLGWAIVENQTDNDWNNVTLDLVGGRPISFIQDLYQPLYVPRPRVAPRTYASLTPQTYDEGIDMPTMVPATPPAPGGRGGGVGGRGRGGGGGFGGAAGIGGMPAEAAAASAAPAAMRAASEMAMDFTQGVQSIAEAGKIGEMFQYSVAGVTLPRQRSSMIPIVTEAVPFDRVSIYNRGVLPRNPLLGVRLKNQTKDYLLAGPVAVLDKIKKPDGQLVEGYAGDATIDDVPAGQERLLSYAIDQGMVVDSEKREAGSRLMTGSIVKGVLRLRFTDAVTQQYVLDNKSERDREVVVEHPIQGGYDLKAPAKALEKTDRLYRFQVPAPAKQTATLVVREERIRWDEMALLPMDLGTLVVYSTNKEIPASVQKALATAADKRRALAEVERKLAQRQADRSRITQDEANIRENIRVLPPGNSRDAAIADLGAKDGELKQADKDLKDLQAAADKARADLEAYLSEMTVE